MESKDTAFLSSAEANGRPIRWAWEGSMLPKSPKLTTKIQLQPFFLASGKGGWGVLEWIRIRMELGHLGRRGG